jgi:hypothetical protein
MLHYRNEIYPCKYTEARNECCKIEGRTPYTLLRGVLMNSTSCCGAIRFQSRTRDPLTCLRCFMSFLISFRKLVGSLLKVAYGSYLITHYHFSFRAI